MCYSKMNQIQYIEELKASYLCVKDSLTDKLISSKELKIALQCFGLSPADEDVENAFKNNMTFEEFCVIGNSFTEFSEEYINDLFSKCIPVADGKIKMTDFVKTFGQLSKGPDNNSSLYSGAKFSQEDCINLSSIVSNILKISKQLKEFSLKRYKEYEKISYSKSKNSQSNVKNDINYKLWKSITVKGSFFIEHDVILSHQYSFSSHNSQDYVLSIKPNDKNILDIGDSFAFIFKEENDKRSYVKHTIKIMNDNMCKCTLNKGKYIIVPFSTGSFKKECATVSEIQLTTVKQKVELTSQFMDILNEIFCNSDLDNNGLLNRQEFNLYNWRTSGDIVEDEEWKAVIDNFEMVEEQLTKEGFISLHQLEAEDCKDNPDELWLALESMGYNRAGVQDRAAHFEVTLYAEKEQPNLTVSGLRSGGDIVDKAFIHVLKDGVVVSNIGGNNDVSLYKDIEHNKAIVLIENKSNKMYTIRVDCTNSVNCVSHRRNLNSILEISQFSTVVAHHLYPRDKNNSISVICAASIIS